MFKKIFLSICLIAIIAYLSLWAWAVHWIDSQENAGIFISDKKNMTLEIAKTIWQITPAIDRNKDAERALKISSFSVYTNLPTIPKDKFNLIDNLQTNYDFISIYYRKHENKLNNKLKDKFLLQKLIFMNRSLRNIKSDIELGKELSNIFRYKAPTIDFNNAENRIDWFPELLWFIYFDNAKDSYLYNKYIEYLKHDLKTMNEKHNTDAFYGVLLFHQASILCYAQYEEKDNPQKQKELNEESANIFRLIQKEITPKNQKEFEVMGETVFMKNSNYLIINPMILFYETECNKEARNFLSKMGEVADILDKGSDEN